VTLATHTIASARGVRRLRLLHTPPRAHPRLSAPSGVPQPLSRTPGAASRLAAAIATHLRGSDSLVEFELGFALPPKDMAIVGAAMSRCTTLRAVSFAGARLGDALLLRLLDGLQASPKLEALCLAGCALGDASGTALACVLREHAHQRAYADWRVRCARVADVERTPLHVCACACEN
jgi:hypothetical protein